MARVKVKKPIPRRYIDGYANSLEMISEEMKRRLTSALEAVDYTRPVAEVREALIPIMQAHVYESRVIAAQAAAEFYDGLREWETGERMGAVAIDGYDPEPVERRVRSSVQPLAEAQDEFYWADDIRLNEAYQEEATRRAARELVKALCEYTGYSVKAAAGGTVFGNGRRDPRAVRFARVPQGSKSYPGGCPFCQMLASRGFRYRSELTAGATDPDHYHDNCRCMVVPSWGPGSVEGYDPRAYDQGYQDYLDQDHSKHEKHVRETQRNRYDKRGRLKSGDGNRVDEKGALTDEDRARIRSMRTAKGNATRKARRERYFSGLGVSESEWKAMSEAEQAALLRAKTVNTPNDGTTVTFPRSVGADTHRDEVRIPRRLTGLDHDIFVPLARGYNITGAHKIAGAGHPDPIHSELDSLKEEFPDVDRHVWEKWAGNGYVVDIGQDRRAHLHWYWSEETGRVRMKVDHFLYR